MRRLASASERKIVLSKYRQTLKHMVLRPPLQKRRIGHSNIVMPAGLGGLYDD